MKPTIEDIKTVVVNMPAKEKDKLLLQLLRKNPKAINKIYYQQVAGKEEIEMLIEDLKNEISALLSDELFKRGRFQKNMARGIRNASQAINEYTSVLRPEQESALYLHILDIIFKDMSQALGTCWTTFDHKVAQTLSKVVTLVSKKLHEDYRVEFEEQVNDYLQRLKKTSSHLDYVYNLPDRLPD